MSHEPNIGETTARRGRGLVLCPRFCRACAETGLRAARADAAAGRVLQPADGGWTLGRPVCCALALLVPNPGPRPPVPGPLLVAQSINRDGAIQRHRDRTGRLFTGGVRCRRPPCSERVSGAARARPAILDLGQDVAGRQANSYGHVLCPAPGTRHRLHPSAHPPLTPDSRLLRSYARFLDLCNPCLPILHSALWIIRSPPVYSPHLTPSPPDPYPFPNRFLPLALDSGAASRVDICVFLFIIYA